MITKREIGPINLQVNNNFSMLQNVSFRALATLMFPMLTTMKMRKKVHVECMPIDISQQKLIQRQQDTILNAGGKPLIMPKNSFDILLYSTISFLIVTPIFKMQQGSSHRSQPKKGVRENRSTQVRPISL